MISLDEKEVKKEQKNQDKEEKRNRKRHKQMNDNEKSMNNRIKGKGLSHENKKMIIIGAIIFILLIITIIFRKPFLNYINNVGRENISDNYALLPDITGFYEEDAINHLKELGFSNIQREYIIDQFTEDKCVIKTNYHINSLIKPDDEIIVYVCDKSIIEDVIDIETEIVEEKNVNTTYFTMNNLSIIDMSVENNTFHFIVKNNNKQAITDISYKIGYQDENKNTIGESKYKLDSNIIILPGEKYEITEELNNSNAYYLYISGFIYKKIDIPENERK